MANILEKNELDKHLCYLENWEEYKIISSEMKVKYCSEGL